MDEISLFLSEETIEKGIILESSLKKIEKMKLDNKKIDAYKIGMAEDSKFWGELYEDDFLPEKNVLENM